MLALRSSRSRLCRGDADIIMLIMWLCVCEWIYFSLPTTYAAHGMRCSRKMVAPHRWWQPTRHDAGDASGRVVTRRRGVWYLSGTLPPDLLVALLFL
eukprot:COSAG01_NODE_5372_length_4300_cov_2310.826511_3_plen_97_part_00